MAQATTNDRQLQKLRDAWNDAVERDRPKDALAALLELEKLEPAEPRWSHRAGDTLRRLGQVDAAEQAHERAVEKYAKAGFLARAVAMAKTIVAANPARADILNKIDQGAARTLRDNADGPPTNARGRTLPASDDVRSDVKALPLRHPARPAQEPSAAERITQEPNSRITPSPQTPPASSARTSSPSSPAPVPSQVTPSVARKPPPPPPVAPPPMRPPPPAPGRADRISITTAVPLAPASNLGHDEVRFDDVPVEQITSIGLTREEVAPVGSDRVYELTEDDYEFVEEEPTAQRLAPMAVCALFAPLSREALSALTLASELVHLNPGSLLLERDTPADALYALVEGCARVELGDEQGSWVRVSEGDVVGEACLLDEQLRQANVRAEGSLVALRIGKSALDRARLQFPEVEDVLFELLVRRLIANTMQSSELFLPFDPPTRIELARLFEVRRAAPGVVLAQRGKRADGLYLLLIGALNVEDEDGKVARLARGSMFGQHSLLSQAPASQTIEAVGEAVVLRLPATRFSSFASAYPPALFQLAESAAQPLRTSKVPPSLPKSRKQ